MDNQKIGEFISSLRKEKGLTQSELASTLNITTQAISKWERGRGCPDISLLDDLSRILDVSILEILKGRKLDKDEKLDNKNLIETMKFTKEKTKSTIKKISNIILIAIIFIITIILIFLNLRSFYYMNKTYNKQKDYTIDNTIFDDVDAKVNLILNNKGNYNEDDYVVITDYVKAIKDLTNTEDVKSFISKDKYTYKDLVKFKSDISLYEITGYNFNIHSEVYKVLVKKDINKLDNMITYNKLISLMLNIINESEIVILEYDDFVNQNDVNYLFYFIEMQYKGYNTILDDIIEVGDIHE